NDGEHDDNTRARCEAFAEAELWARDSTTFDQRVVLLRCFPHRADWARELAMAAIAGRSAQGGRSTLLTWNAGDALLVSLQDEPVLKELLTDVRRVTWSIVNILRPLRERAAPILGELLARVKSSSDEHAVSATLACVGTAEAASYLARHLRRQRI